MSRRRSSLILGLACSAHFACSSDDSADAGSGPPDAAVVPVWYEDRTVPTREDLFAVFGRSINEVWAVGWNGTIIRWDGFGWTQEASTSTVPLTDIHGRPTPEDLTQPPGPIFAVGWGGTILQRDAAGNWSKVQVYGQTGMITSTVTQDLFGVYSGADDSAVAVGDSGRVIEWDGRRWSVVQLRIPSAVVPGGYIEPIEVLKGVFSRNGNAYFISGSGGASFCSNNGFQSFEGISTPSPDPLRGIWAPPGGPFFTVGNPGLILYLTGGCEPGRWIREQGDPNNPIPNAFYFDVHGRNGNDITVVGWKGTSVRFLDGQWFPEPTGTDKDLRGVWVDEVTGAAFAVGAGGLVLRRDPPPEPDASVTD